MGGIGGMLGLSGGAAGTGFAAPAQANIVGGTTPEQIAASQQGTGNSLQSQQALLSALQAQGGLGNQNQVYNQLQGVVAGTGPNPAQAMLANSTGANVQNQAALMAGQRGAGANPALIARQAAMQGGALQQNALGQAAALQAQQSLGALGQAGQMATQQAGQQIGQTNQNLQGQLSNQQLQQQALAAQNQANVASQGSVNQGNTTLAGNQMQAQRGIVGGIMNAAGGGLGLAEGGTVPGYAGGGGVLSSIGKNLQQDTGMAAPEKKQDSPLPGLPAMGGSLPVGSTMLPASLGSAAPLAMLAADGGMVGPASSVGRYLHSMAHGGNVGSSLKAGGHVPGKAAKAGNDYANDTVDAKLSPGELVVDRETMNDKGKAGDAARFLAAVINAKKGKK